MIPRFIITHSGNMHQDETFALAILQRIHPQASVIRSRDRGAPEPDTLFVDVGGSYQPELGIFDHHQRGGAGTRANGAQYASAGLIWKHFGREYLQRSHVPEASLETVWEMMDDRWIQSIDAFDCGDVDFGRTAHAVTGQNLRDIRMSHILDAWNAVDSNLFFREAVQLAQTLLDHWIQTALQLLEVRRLFQSVPQSYWVELPGDNLPWRELVSHHPHILYVLQSRPDHHWTLTATPISPHSMTLRKPFPEAWRGRSHSELQAIAGLPGLVFCHASGFLTVIDTRENALRLLGVLSP